MIASAKSAEASGNFAAAQEHYGNAAERLRFSNPAEAERLQELAGKNVGKILGVDQPTTSVNGKSTITPALSNKLKLYQKQANIPVTGVIDQTTRRALAR